MSSWRCNQQSSDYSLCENAKLTFDANAIALLFAERILDHPEMIEQLIETEKEGKAYTLAELTKHGYETRDCRGNFIFRDNQNIRRPRLRRN